MDNTTDTREMKGLQSSTMENTPKKKKKKAKVEVIIPSPMLKVEFEGKKKGCK
jgi:hypothetical protein